MSNDDHRELAEVLSGIEGRAAVSGYRTALYDDLYESWRRVDAAPKTCHSVRQLRQESLWLNYDKASDGSNRPT